MRSRYFFASECALYLPDDIPLCSSATVNSSSSNAGGATDDAMVSALLLNPSLAEVERLTLARATLLMMPLRTNFLRFMLKPLVELIVDRGTSIPRLIKSKTQKRT